MKIIFYNHTGLISGAEKMLLLLLADLSRDRFDLELLSPLEGALQAEAKSLGLSTYVTRPIAARFTYNPFRIAGYLFSIARAMLDTRKAFNSLKPDVIHANTVRAGIVATIATTGTDIPLIWHIHDMLPDHPLTQAVRSLAHSSNRIHLVACSQAAADTLKPFKKSGNAVEVIPNGLEMVVAPIDPKVTLEKRKELGIAPSSFVVAIIGMITQRKGQLGLIRAFAKLREVAPDSLLLIVGSAIFNKDHQYLSLLEEEVQTLQLETSVRFLGQRTDVPMLLQVTDMLVVNSTAEPFALVLIEAMRIGNAVLATDCGGPREIIKHGVSGEIVPLGNPAALVEAMVRFQRDPDLRAQYGAAAEEAVRSNFTKEKYIERWSRLYESLLSNTSSPLESLAIANKGASLETGDGH